MKRKILLAYKDFPHATGNTQSYSIDEKIVSPDPRNFQISKNISGKVDITKLGQTFLANFNLIAQLQIPCSRCNKPMDQKIKLNFKQEYFRRDLRKDHLDILPAISQELILSLPTKILCKETCQGLCPNCGQNLNLRKCNCKKIKKSPFEKLKGYRVKGSGEYYGRTKKEVNQIGTKI